MLNSSTAEEIVMMAIKNCHAKNVDSFPYLKIGNRLSREFIAGYYHKLNSHNMAVGPHDHRYPARLEFVSGCPLYNVNYKEIGYPGEYTELFYKWKINSFLNGGTPTIVDNSYLIVTDVKVLHRKGESLVLDDDKIHTVFSAGPCRWRVHEGKTVKEETTLYTKTNSINIDGLYNRFSSKDEVLAYYNSLLETLRL